MRRASIGKLPDMFTSNQGCFVSPYPPPPPLLFYSYRESNGVRDHPDFLASFSLHPS